MQLPPVRDSSGPFARTHIITPLSLIFVTSALRVDALIPGTPSSAIHSESVCTGGPVARPLAVLLDDDPAHLDPTRTRSASGSPIDVQVLHARDPVVPDERVREAEHLARVGGVGHRLGISHHPRVEDDLADRSSSRRRNPSRGRATRPQEAGRPGLLPSVFSITSLKEEKLRAVRVFKRFDQIQSIVSKSWPMPNHARPISSLFLSSDIRSVSAVKAFPTSFILTTMIVSVWQLTVSSMLTCLLAIWL